MAEEMTEVKKTTAELIQERLEILRGLHGLRNISYSRQEGSMIEYACRIDTPRATVRVAEETNAELGRLIDSVAGALSSPHLAGSLGYSGNLNALTLESTKNDLFGEHFGMPLAALRKTIEEGRGKLAEDLWRKLQEGIEEIPKLRSKLWRDANLDLAPLGFQLAESGNPWRKILKMTTDRQAPAAPRFHAIVEMDEGSADEVMIRAGLPPASYRPLEQLARQMFGVNLEEMALAINERLDSDGARPILRTDVAAWDIEQKMDLMAVAQRHFYWENGKPVDILFEMRLDIWPDIMQLHPGLAEQREE